MQGMHTEDVVAEAVAQTKAELEVVCDGEKQAWRDWLRYQNERRALEERLLKLQGVKK